MDVVQFTEIKWLPLVCTGCKLDMSNLHQGYDWMKCFVFLEARNEEKAQAHSFSSQLQQQTTHPNAVPNLREFGV